MKFEPILKSKYVDFGALYLCPVCHQQISTPHDGKPNFCSECGIALEWETDEEKRKAFAKTILDYWETQGTEKTILFLRDVAEVD